MSMTIADRVSIVALIISIFGISWTAINYFVGARVSIYPPKQIEFRCNNWWKRKVSLSEKCDDNSQSYLTITADSLALINSGEPGYNGIVMYISAEIPLLSNTLKFKWKYFSKIAPGSYSVEPAKPILIPGRSASSEEIVFYPKDRTSIASFISWPEFKKALLVTKGLNKIESINLSFKAYKPDGSDFLETSCTVIISDTIRSNIREEPKSFISLPCFNI